MKDMKVDWDKTNFSEMIEDECADMAVFLIEKNEKYGNSVGNPIGVFSKAGWEERMHVRMDDKINRLLRGDGNMTEDTEKDLLGYLILKRAIQRVIDAKDENLFTSEKQINDRIKEEVEKDKISFPSNAAINKKIKELSKKEKRMMGGLFSNNLEDLIECGVISWVE